MNLSGISRLLRFAACVPALVLLFSGVYCYGQGVVNGALLVRLGPRASIDRVARDYGLYVLDGVDGRDVYEVMAQDQAFSGMMEMFLNFDSRVRYCEQEASTIIPEVQADPFHISFEISADATAYISQPAYKLVDLGDVPSVNTGSANAASAPVTVAVMDTGADPANSDLAGALLPGYNELSPNSPPLDVADGQNNIAAGHGTMVAGVVARTSPNSVIMPIRVLNGDGVGTLMHVIKGIHYAVTHGANVINMSFEIDVHSVALADAIDEAYNQGIVIVASAGNDSTSAPRFPAAYPNVIGVASVEDDDTLSQYSNYGVNATLVAPGSYIRSTYLGGNFATWSGTSFAAPFAAAEAAEIVARNPEWTPAQVTGAMVFTANSVDYLNPGFANMLGAGIIDVQAALCWPGQ